MENEETTKCENCRVDIIKIKNNFTSRILSPK